MSLTIGGVTVPEATGAAPGFVFGYEGALPKVFPIGLPYGLKFNYLAGPPAAPVLTLAMMRAGIQTARADGMSVFSVPTINTLLSGGTLPSDGSFIPMFQYQNIGDGNLTINPEAGVEFVWNGLNPAFLPSRYGIMTMFWSGVNTDTGNEVWTAM